MAKILNKEPAVYHQEQENFLRELRKFHDQKGTGFKHIPCILGKEIDLYLLYWLVTAQGGWEKVNSKDGWDDLLETFGLPSSTTNGSLSLKQTYLRYLDSYEKYYFLGEEEEDESGLYYDEEDSRARRQRAQRIVQSVPSTYNEGQHRIAENLRSHYGLSTDIYRKTDYDRLGLSLLSPLPNEQDFAINVCTLLSNEGRHTLKLGKCPRLLDLLLAHAGVFNHSNLRTYTTDTYLSSRNYDLIKFWRDVCREKSVLELIYDEKNFCPKTAVDENGEAVSGPATETPTKPVVGPQESVIEEVEAGDAVSRIAALKSRAEADLESSDDELFASGRSNGTRELTGQRVLQVATVIRNLSFEEDNSPVLAKNLTCLRFVLLCVNSSWANLNQMGFDILSNIAAEVQLEEPSEDAVTELLLSTLSRCIGAQDRFQVISSLDVLNKLCGQQVNEDFIQRLLDQAVYGQLTEYLSLHDIHLLITVLECLYSLTSLGELPCNALVKTHSAVELLVSLVTVEAQSYGPKACILMRVVETVPGTTAQGTPAPASSLSPAMPQTPVPISRVPGGPPMLPTAPLPQPSLSNILPRHPLGPGLHRPMAPGTPGMAGAPVAAPPRPQGTPSGSQQVQLRVSNEEPHRVFCLSWLKATYEPCTGKSIEQNIMYKQYLASMHRMGRKEVISAQHYALCIRTLFGGSTGPNKKAVGDKVENHYTGIQVRAQPLPLKLTPAQAAAAQEASRAQAAVQPPQNGVGGAQFVQARPQMTQGQQQIVQVKSQGQAIQQQQQPTPPQPPPQQIVQKVMVNSQGQLVDTQGRLVQLSSGATVSHGRATMEHSNSNISVSDTQGNQGQGQQVITGNSQGQQMVSYGNQGQQVVTVNSQGQQLVNVNSQGQQVMQQGQQIFQMNNHGQQVITVNSQGQQVQQVTFVNSQGQQVNSQGQQVVQVNNQGQHVVQMNNQGQQVVQVNPQAQQMVQVNNQGQIVKQITPSNVVTLNQAGQVVQQRIVNSSGQIVAQGVVQGGTVMSQGMAPRAPVVVQAGTPRQLVQRVVQAPGGQQVMLQGTQGQGGHYQVHNSGVDADPHSLKQPKSPILQDLLKHRVTEPDTTMVNRASNEDLENGASPLDGILPMDPKFGQLEGADLSDLLESRKETMANGHVTDYGKMNGEKRPAVEGVDGSPAKRQALEGVVTNGVVTSNGSVNGGGMRGVQGSQGMVIVSQAGSMSVPQNSPMQGQLVKSASGQLFIKTTSSSGGAVLVPAGQQSGQGGVLVQQGGQKLLLVNNQGRQVVMGSQGGQQAVVRVSAPLASVPAGEQHVTQIDGAAEDREEALPQLDGAGDELILPGVSTSLPGAGAGDPAPAALLVPVTNGRSTPSSTATPPPSSPTPSPSPPPALQSTVKIDTQKPFLCEWAGCMKAYKTPKEVENHAIAEHCSLGTDDIPCLWARCDGMRRKRFSLMTHLQDRHCHPQLMKLMAVRRVQIAQSGKSDVPLPPAPPPHPGYAPNAALHAIKRHAVEFVSPKELAMRDEKEGPVTKSIRLTASLILRNLVIYSSLGRSRLRAYESHLSTVALSNVESSRTVSQILFDMANSTDFQ